MFERLSERLYKAFQNITGKTFTENNVSDTLVEIRAALLEADVAFEVIDSFLSGVQTEMLGQAIPDNLSAAQGFVQVVHTRLITLLGESQVPLNLNAQAPVVILMAGLQGSGKTTSTGKLALRLISEGKKVGVASADIYRPAAIDQLETLATQVGARFFPTDMADSPVTIAKKALLAAQTAYVDVLIMDTAGRLHIDTAMMEEIKAIHAVLAPTETLFVVDGMTGQDAARTARVFSEALPLTGLIVTKLEGDTRGGAILSLRHITGCPVKFVGMGEKMDALDPFYPDRMASRILGMGDVLSLIEKMKAQVTEAEAAAVARRLESGQFNLEDFRQQLLQMGKMGGVSSLMESLPMMGMMPDAVKSQVHDTMFQQTLAVLNSMTKQERRYPGIINGSRKKRIAKGSGTTTLAVNKVLKQFEQMQKMMKMVRGKGGMARMMQQLQGQKSPFGR